MKRIVLAFAILALSLTSFVYAEETFDNGVLVLTDDTFDAAV